ncbi:MAG TPA: M23 family metallopeptidase [Desulfotignum sp.]|nr:M23 family metallopeptidase [Desulfotignum sp.]
MKHRIKIWFHSGSSPDIREITLHKVLVVFLLIAGMAAAGGIGWMGYDYHRLRSLSFDTATQQQVILSQKGEIQTQRQQLQQFAAVIEDLKTRVNDLDKLEDQVRLIADIKKSGSTKGFIGIGGIPENSLDHDLPLEEKHNSLLREMHQQVDQTALTVKQQFLDFDHLIKELEKKKNLLASTPSIRPVEGWITSGFGYRKSPFTGKRDFHAGLDISNKTGTKIIATADGKISYASRKALLGNLVTIDHGYGRVTRYGHLDKILVKRGQRIKRGDVIAHMGNTGRSTGPHLHYEVRINGTPVDPVKYILN